MSFKNTPLLVLTVLVFLGGAALSSLSSTFHYPYSQYKMSSLNQYAAMDLTAIVSGMRRLGSDIAWIQLLQYYGTPEDPECNDEEDYELSWLIFKDYLGFKVDASKHHHHHNCGHDSHGHKESENAPTNTEYSQLLAYCNRVTGFDPFFTYAYLYGAGALAWNEKRQDEAIKLLESGIHKMETFKQNITKDTHNPFWQFNLYLGAIAYSQKDDITGMLSSLEIALKQENCPNMIKAIVANIYEKQTRKRDALKLWLDIFDSKDPTYTIRSKEKISQLSTDLGLN